MPSRRGPSSAQIANKYRRASTDSQLLGKQFKNRKKKSKNHAHAVKSSNLGSDHIKLYYEGTVLLTYNVDQDGSEYEVRRQTFMSNWTLVWRFIHVLYLVVCTLLIMAQTIYVLVGYVKIDTDELYEDY